MERSILAEDDILAEVEDDIYSFDLSVIDANEFLITFLVG